MYIETQDSTLKPSEYPYNYVLNCAANTVGSREDKLAAFKVATKTYQDLRSSPDGLSPDSFTYAFWIKACNNLLPHDTELYVKCVTLAFEQCQKEGLVTSEVLTRLQQGGLGPERICQLLDVPYSKGKPIVSKNVRIDDLQPSWCRNATTKRPKAGRT
jgi:hypothetical protein